jgi:AcrR family transcriptional regulator
MTTSTACKPTGDTPPRSRLRALSPDRQAALLDPAAREFAEHGYERASLNRILAAANMSKGQAYHYIAGKADLYAAVIDRATTRLLERLDLPSDRPRDADAYWNQIELGLARLTEVLLDDGQLAALARGIYDGPQAQAALAEPLGRLRSQLQQLVVAGQRLGAVRDDLPESLVVDTALAAARAIDRWFAEHWDDLDPAEARRFNSGSFEMIRALCAPPAPRDDRTTTRGPST